MELKSLAQEMRFLKAGRKCSDYTVQRQTLKRKDMGHEMQEESEDSHKESQKNSGSLPGW